MESRVDLLVIGGGINGTGIAADAAGRGLSVCLCEKSDLAGATSSWSTKLIHGGLRYLENYDFLLVRKALKEREVLIEAAPHIIRPIAFQIPQLANSRPAWMIQAGLFLYDNLARRRHFKGSRKVRYDADSPLDASIRTGFEYWDAQVDDSRLVVLNALQAHRKGAEVLTRCECVAIEALDDGWKVRLFDHFRQQEVVRHCKVLVNASGPWVASLLANLTQKPAPHEIRLVKGSHIVVPRMHEGDHAFMLQHDDGRIVFVIPYLQDYSLVGTTEEEYVGDPGKATISEAESSYLLSIVNHYFKRQLQQADIVYSYSGVRPLIDEKGKNASKVSRDYEIEKIENPHPILSVYGGKVTTYRVLAEHVLEELSDYFPELGPDWTSSVALPGGDFAELTELRSGIQDKFPWLERALLERWCATYGSDTAALIGDAASMSDLGEHFGNGLYQREVEYLQQTEWARTADDILWRRTKLGYVFTQDQIAVLDSYLERANQV